MATQILTHGAEDRVAVRIYFDVRNFIGNGTSLTFSSFSYPNLNSPGKYYANVDFYLPPQIVKTS